MIRLSWKQRWLIITLLLTITSFIIYQIPTLWVEIMEARISVPTKFLSSFRLWSILNWQIWFQSAYNIAEKKKVKHPIILAFAMFAFVLSVGDIMWTVTNNLKWNMLFYYEDWVRLQPLQHGISYHSITLIVATIISLPVLMHFHKKKVFKLQKLFLGMGLLCIFSFAKVFLAPTPAWTDWGYLTFVHPEMQAYVPKYLVFILNDIISRSIILFAILYSGAPTRVEKPNSVNFMKTMKKIYDYRYGKEDNKPSVWMHGQARDIIKFLSPAKESILLDVGAGFGFFTKEIAKKTGCMSVGVDLSREGMLAANKAKISSTHFINASATHLPFRENVFSHIMCNHVLEHIPDDKLVLNEFQRVMRRQGKLYISNPNRLRWIPMFLWVFDLFNDWRRGHLRRYSPQEIVKMLRDRGFRIVRIHYHDHIKVIIKLLGVLSPRYRNAKLNLYWKIHELDRSFPNFRFGSAFFIIGEKNENA